MISAAPACEGTVTTYSWSDGFNPPVTWVYTYTVEYQDFTMPANAGSTVACQPQPMWHQRFQLLWIIVEIF